MRSVAITRPGCGAGGVLGLAGASMRTSAKERPRSTVITMPPTLQRDWSEKAPDEEGRNEHVVHVQAWGGPARCARRKTFSDVVDLVLRLEPTPRERAERATCEQARPKDVSTKEDVRHDERRDQSEHEPDERDGDCRALCHPLTSEVRTHARTRVGQLRLGAQVVLAAGPVAGMSESTWYPYVTLGIGFQLDTMTSPITQ